MAGRLRSARAARAALDDLRRQLDGVAALGGVGVITPAAWGMFTRRLPPFDEPPRTVEQDREVLRSGLAELGEHAVAAGVALLFEPLNRYEDHMVNTLAQGAELIAGLPGVRLLADTYHMNIEEDDPCAALRAAAGVLGAVHLSDSNRASPAPGTCRSRRSSPRCARSGSTACCRSSAACAASRARRSASAALPARRARA